MAENESESVVLDTDNDGAEVKADAPAKETKAEKPAETPEQRKARLERQLKRVKKELGEDEDEDVPPKKQEPTELDYGQRAFLKTYGISGSDELALVREYIKRTGDSLDALVEDDIFKAKLEKLRATKANELAASAATGRGNAGAGGRTSVDYWIAKGEHPPRELGSKLAQDYVEAMRNKGKNSRVFYSD